jgi:hypothetical protein
MIKPVAKNSNMYQGWVTHTKSYLRGECPHHCSYCYVRAMVKRFAIARYEGLLRLEASELDERLGKGRIVFIEHMNDLWCDEVPEHWIVRVLDHCFLFPGNRYVFQTKNPRRLEAYARALPKNSIVGITLETNLDFPEIMGRAPRPDERVGSFFRFGQMAAERPIKRFVTIEPVLDFDLPVFTAWLIRLRPDFVNIGADSKGHGLPEPSPAKLSAFIAGLRAAGLDIKEKSNLGRILDPKTP